MGRKTFKKIITSEEVKSQISKENLQLMKLFLKDKDRKCSEKTIFNYQSDLNIFFCWNVMENNNKFYPEIKKSEMSMFFSYCIDELKWNGKRFARMRSVLSGLSDIVIKYYDDDYPTFRNYINSVIEAIPKPPAREKTVLTDAECEKMLKTLKENKEYQQACFLALALYSGCRIAELEQFTVDLIDENNVAFGGVMLETTRKIRCKGFGKEGHVIYKYIIKDLFLPYLKLWLPERERILKEKGKENEKALFIKQNGDKATQNVFRSWLEKWEKEIINKPLYAHMLRHRLVTYLASIGLSSDYIVAIVGWKDAKMVNIYNDLEDKDRDWKDSDKLQKVIDEFLEDDKD